MQSGSDRDAVEAAQRSGLYSSLNEHDSCGVGFVVNIKGNRSHELIENALLILHNLNHRGAVGADTLYGDGAGILIQIPDAFYRQELLQQGVKLPPPGEYGVGTVFLPREHASRLACEQELERSVRAEGQVVLGWRDVPVDRDMPMSPRVREREPVIRQIFIGRGHDIMVPDALERKLYVIRKTASHKIQALRLKHGREYFVPSMSTRTVVYKGLLLADQVGRYYRDLADPRVESAIGLVHQRFSTNTFPSWELAHPYRMVAHNGEINTVKGNFNWMRAREGVMSSPVLREDLRKLYPLIYEGQSDTACFDNALELLVMAGYPLAHAMMMMIPEAWEQHTLMDESRRAFYEYHASMMEPWDGPAAIAFTDGVRIGATLDRNGLRPARYVITDDDFVVMASEVGVLPIAESKIVKKWRLQPGKMFLIDTEQGRIIDDAELKTQLAASKPYKEWIRRIRVRLDELPTLSSGSDVATLSPGPSSGLRPEEAGGRERGGSAGPLVLPPADVNGSSRTEGSSSSPLPLAGEGLGVRVPALLDRQQAFGYTQEDVRLLMLPMATDGEEPVGSMGNDTALPVSGAVGSRQDPVRLLQADVRAGHQPADRSDPRAAGDVAGELRRSEAQSAGYQQHQSADAPGSGPAGPGSQGHGQDPLDRFVHLRQVPRP